MNLQRERKVGITAYGLAIIIVFLVLILIAVPQFQKIKDNVTYLDCKQKKIYLEKAIQAYLLENSSAKFVPFKEVDQVELNRKKFLRNFVACPEGGVYKINDKNEVYCTYHDWKMEQ